jgi:diguanylate cyclase (GGDEF)-like protein
MAAHFHQLTASRQSTSFVRTGLLHRDGDVLGDEIYTELVGRLYETFLPLVIVACAYIALSLIAFRAHGDAFLAVVGTLGSIIAVARVTLVFAYRTLSHEQRCGLAVALLWERRYTYSGYFFGVCLGLLEAKLFFDVHEVVPLGIALLYGYCAGVAARVFIRPRIAIGSLVLAGLPALAGMIAQRSVDDLCLAAFSFVFLLGAFETVFHLYKSIVASVILRYEFAALARHDELTGLPNRLQIREKLNHEIARLRRHGGLVAIHYLDLDRFKMANDNYGHPTGDQVLKHVAKRLGRLVRTDDLIARLGGDEFLLVQTGIAHRGEAEVLAMRIIRSLAQPFEINGQEIVIGASVGIAIAPIDSVDVATLIKYADDALYEAKSRGRSSFVFHKNKTDEAATDRRAAAAPNAHSASA